MRTWKDFLTEGKEPPKEILNYINNVLVPAKDALDKTNGTAEKFIKPIEYVVGKKYVKLYIRDSVIGFIDIKTGDILKAASWKAPAKGIRGNIANGTAEPFLRNPRVFVAG